MAARGPPASISVQSYQPGRSSNSYRPRSRNRSAGSSGPSSREHSVEGRSGDNRRGGGGGGGGALDVRGSGDFRASYHNQYKGPSKRELEAVARAQQHFAVDKPVNYESKGRVGGGGGGGQGWGFGGDGGSSNGDQYWRSDRGGIHGRVQGVFPDDEGVPMGMGSSARGYALTIGGGAQGRGSSGAATSQRQENGYGSRQQQRQENNNSHGGGNQWQENGYGGQQRQQENLGYGGKQGHGRASQGGSSLLGQPAGALRFPPGRELGGSSKEGVFGDSRELQTFGSPRGLSRTAKAALGPFLSAKEEAKLQRGKNYDARNTRDGGGDPRRSFSNEIVGRGEGWSSNSSVKGGYRDNTQTNVRRGGGSSEEIPQLGGGYAGGAQMQIRRDESQGILGGGGQGQRVQAPPLKKGDEEFVIPSPSSSNGRSNHARNSSMERERGLSGELPIRSPRSSSKGIFSRKNSFDRRKKREDSAQLPVFSPSSEGKVGISRESSFDKLSRESSVSESAFKDPGLEGDGKWSKEKQVSGKVWESASAGMHRTRSTDWYEICLKEEEEEELEALAKKLEEEESKRITQSSTPMKVSSFSNKRVSSTLRERGESEVFTPRSARGEIKLGTNNLDRGWVHERLVRGDAADSAQPNFSGSQRNPDSGGRQGLFTPWNSLQQSVPTLKTGPQSGPRPNSLLQQLENNSGEPRDGLLKYENLRVSIAGGRQASSRRVVNAFDTDESENWRPERRPSRDYSKPAFMPESLRESVASRLERVVAKKTSEREEILSSSVEVEERRVPKQTSGREVVLGSSVDSEKRPPKVVTQRVNGAIRPAAFYRALREATAGDEEPLPHIVGTCPDMCPEKERLQRERLRDLAVFERVSGDMRKTSQELAVKKFCRTVVASELQQSDVRPLSVLWRTQQYLLGLLDDPEFSFDIVHNFLFDRTRAIRQELGMQRIVDHQTITIHEEIVRFHILSEHELREQNRKRSKQFDTHLNLQQLLKSLHSLLNLYIMLGGESGAHFENEAEFHAYYVLLNLGNHGRFQAEPLSLWFPNVTPRVLEGAPMQFARKALRFYRSNNFVGYFRLVREATYLQSCLLELNFDSVRATALATLNVAEYKLHPYPLSDLAQQLILEEKEVDELCMYYGLLTGMENSTQKLCLLAKQAQFATPEKESLPQFSCPLIDSKRAPAYFLEVKGAPTEKVTT